MSAGPFLENGKYEANSGIIFPVRVQPETLTLTLNGVANALPTNDVTLDVPSALVGAGRRRNGVICRLVRIQFTAAVPPGYDDRGVIALPVLTPTAFATYSLKNVTGTYTLEGTAYDVRKVGVTPEEVN